MLAMGMFVSLVFPAEKGIKLVIAGAQKMRGRCPFPPWVLTNTVF